MARVDELQKRYPSLPREVLIKWDVLQHGLKDSKALTTAGNWFRSLPTYQSYDREISLKEAAENAGRVKGGFVKTAWQFCQKNGMGTQVQRDSTSPYEIRDMGFGRYVLYEGEVEVQEVYFPRDPRPWPEEPLTSKGTPVTNLVTINSPVCVQMVPVRYCEYFALGEQCRFCNWNAGNADARLIGLDRPITISLDDAAEAYQIIASDLKLSEYRIQPGGLRNNKQTFGMLFSFMEKLATATPHKPNFTINTEPMERADLQRLKDVGLDCIGFQMEVWDPRVFPIIAPAKAKYTGYERYLEAFQDAVDVFGVGNVMVNFVGGVTVVPENGHQTWQEARDWHAEGNRWMIKHGVFPTMTPVRLGPGSVYGDDPNLRGKRPPTEFYLEVGMAHHEAMMEYDRYKTLNKFVICPMECHALLYAGEIGIATLYGSVRNWLANKPLS